MKTFTDQVKEKYPELKTKTYKTLKSYFKEYPSLEEYEELNKALQICFDNGYPIIITNKPFYHYFTTEIDGRAIYIQPTDIMQYDINISNCYYSTDREANGSGCQLHKEVNADILNKPLAGNWVPGTKEKTLLKTIDTRFHKELIIIQKKA